MKNKRSRISLETREKILSHKRRGVGGASSQSGSSRSITVFTRKTNSTKATKVTKEGQAEIVLVVQRSNRNLHLSKKKNKTDETI